jgi:hypothetical protein
MRTISLAIVIAVLAASFVADAGAHGVAKPRHGGLVDVGGETTFELVRAAMTVKIFVEDHGKPVDTRGASGELLLGSETGRRLALLKGFGVNGLAGTSLAFKAGDRLFVRVTLGNGSVEVGEFRVP